MVVAVLLALLAQADGAKQAEALFQAMEDRIWSADTIDIEFKSEMISPNSKKIHSGRVALKKGNKYLENRSIEGYDSPWVIRTRSDGEKMLTHRFGLPVDRSTAKAPASSMYKSVSLSIARVTLDWYIFFGDGYSGSRNEISNRLRTENFTLGDVETIREREAREVKYTVHFAGNEAENRVWINTKTKMPMKRVFRYWIEGGGKRIYIEHREEYTRFEVNSELKESLFDLANIDK